MPVRSASRPWTRRDRSRVAGMFAVVALLHVVGFGTLLLVVAPREFELGTGVFSVGLGVTAYLLGLRHAFDADHIAAIDNVTRKLAADGGRSRSVGFFFALGHSATVVALALIVVVAARAAGVLLDDSSPARHALGMAGTLLSGGFLYLIAIVNLIALGGIWRVFSAARTGRHDDAELGRRLDELLDGRGVLARVLRPVVRRINRPGQMFVVGALFGLGFDTATEVTLLALAGSGAVAGVPWYAVLTLPVLFAAGMALMDSVDGVFMAAAYDWAFAEPLRKIYYNLTVTGLSVAVAGLVGTVELVSVLRDDLGWSDPVTGWLAALSLEHVGYAVVALFVATWAVAVTYWRVALRN